MSHFALVYLISMLGCGLLVMTIGAIFGKKNR